MRSRVGGFIGQAWRPTSYSANGMWTLGEQYVYRFDGQWPRNYLDISAYEYVDATQNGDAYLSPSINANPSPSSYVWKKSTDGGLTWSVVYAQTAPYLSLSGLTPSSDGNLYRIEASIGLRSRISTPIAIRYESSFSYSWYSPSDFSGSIGSQAGFYMQPTAIVGSKYGTYYGEGYRQWQQSTNGGSTWTDIPGEDYYWLYVTIQSGMSGRKYRMRSRVSQYHSWYDSPAATLTIS